MLNYLNLPDNLFDFVLPFDYKNQTYKDQHDWNYLPTTSVLKPTGIAWFKNKGINFFNISNIFKCPRNFQGPIHDDGLGFAINFVLEGNGTMEWVSDIEGIEKSVYHNNADFKVYREVKSFKVYETWEGKVALVNVNLPHRVVAQDIDRYCLSIRSYSPKTFDEAYKLLYNYSV